MFKRETEASRVVEFDLTVVELMELVLWKYTL